jgi:hypothetical protein
MQQNLPQTKEGSSSISKSRQKTGLRHWLRFGDLIVVILTVVLAAALLWMAPQLVFQQKMKAVLIQNGQVIRQWSEQEMAAGGEETLTSNGYHYHIAWQDGRIRFAEADCPDKVCVRTGWLGHPGSVAACVPGNLILKFSISQNPGTTETSDVDVVIK